MVVVVGGCQRSAEWIGKMSENGTFQCHPKKTRLRSCNAKTSHGKPHNQVEQPGTPRPTSWTPALQR